MGCAPSERVCAELCRNKRAAPVDTKAFDRKDPVLELLIDLIRIQTRQNDRGSFALRRRFHAAVPVLIRNSSGLDLRDRKDVLHEL